MHEQLHQLVNTMSHSGPSTQPFDRRSDTYACGSMGFSHCRNPNSLSQEITQRVSLNYSKVSGDEVSKDNAGDEFVGG